MTIVKNSEYTSLEVCAGAGGQAIGMERAGFRHLALVENDRHACATLRLNRPEWNVFEEPLETFNAQAFHGVDVVSGGVPCPPFSRAGAQLGKGDARNLFPHALRVISEVRPRAVMFENVRGILDRAFDDYRSEVRNTLEEYGLDLRWKLLQASNFGVPQLRPRAIGIALPADFWYLFDWPAGSPTNLTVGEALYVEMAKGGWPGAEEWRDAASRIAPTLVGGSKKHGGADLGPTRAKRQWANMGVDALVLGDCAPGPQFTGAPRLTVRMAAILQGFPENWEFAGGKTAAYRQVGNAFPAPVAEAVSVAILRVLKAIDAGAKPMPISEQNAAAGQVHCSNLPSFPDHSHTKSTTA
jgi:DNA (cytosine-5)-methyltransferase 1